MKKYHYNAIKNHKELVTGYIDANDNNNAAEKIRAMGLMPSFIEEYSYTAPKNISFKTYRRLPIKDMILFTDTIQTYLSSGISILSALENLSEFIPNKRIKKFSSELYQRIKGGKSLYIALRELNTDKTYAALCKTADEAGTLPETLKYLKMFLQKQSEHRTKFIRISAYPAFLLAIIFGLIMFFGGFVLPKILDIIGSDEDIPTLAKLFISCYDFLVKAWWLMIIVLVGLIIAWHDVFQQKVKELLENICIKIPILKNCFVYLALSHYMTALYFAYEAGMSINDALTLAQETIGNKFLKKKANKATLIVKNGNNISDAFKNSELIPEVYMPIIISGERAGKLSQSFRDLSVALTKKLDIIIETIENYTGPVLLTVIGGFVGIICIVLIQVFIAAFTF